MAKGKFETSPIKEHHVTCAYCEKMFVTHFPYQKTAIGQARENGWRIRAGKWCCPIHAEQKIRPTDGGLSASDNESNPATIGG